jgi:hypothetical protein
VVVIPLPLEYRPLRPFPAPDSGDLASMRRILVLGPELGESTGSRRLELRDLFSLALG